MTRRQVPVHAARRAWGVVLLGLLLQACATAPVPVRPGVAYSGRLAVRADAVDASAPRAISGQFELSGDPAVGQLVLISPLGSIVARARWSAPAGPFRDPSVIELEADGGTTRFDTLDAMMRQAVGDSLPLAAMFDWLAGRPWPGAPALRDASGTSFDQLGWRVDESRQAADGLILADRHAPLPALHVRIKLDPPASAPAP